MTKWEYISEEVRVIWGAKDDLGDHLNRRGEAGWELILLHPLGGSMSHTSYHLLFKRAKEQSSGTED